MFENSVFTSQFWEWFIIIPTIGGIIGCFLLVKWVSSGSVDPDAKVETMGHVWDGDLEEYNNPLPMWWLNMFYITLVCSIIYLVLYPGLGSFAGVLGWSEVNEYEQEMAEAEKLYAPIFAKYQGIPVAELAKQPEAVQIGHRLFLNYCTACHASDAGGVKGFPNLRDEDWLYGGAPKTIEMTIMNGRQGIMPAGLVGAADAKNVAQYVLSLSDSQHDSTAATEGQKVFKRVCFACHGMDGKGMQAMGAPNLTDKAWLYGGSPSTIEATILNGRRGKMPAHGDFLGEAKVHLLATYVYSLSAAK